MKFTFENQGTHTYLVYAIKEEDHVDSMSLGMLTNNKITGLAHVLFTQMDATRYIKYDVSAKISVKQFFEGQVNKKRLLGAFHGIVDAMLSAEEYMIDVNSILLDFNYIFADVSTCETVLICLPIENETENNTDLGSFFKTIMFNTQFDPTENCDHVAKIINYLNSTPAFSLEEFKKVLDSIDETAFTQMPTNNSQQPVVQAAPVSQQTQALKQQVQHSEKKPESISPKPAQPHKVLPSQNPAYSSAVPPKQKQPVPAAVSNEPKMSFWYLMQHYNAQNAAIYKAQKEAKKGNKGGSAAPAARMSQPKAPAKPGNPGFAVPGQQPNAAQPFAIPGQQTNAQPFAIPGQQPAQAEKTSAAPLATPPVPKPLVQTTPSVAQQPPVQVQPVAQPVQQFVQPSRPINFGETTVLGAGIGETSVLDGGAAPVKNDPHLIRTKNNEKIPLNKPAFRIGKERSYVDYFISDNTAISRSHANILNHNGEFFVVDTNSTNHTYVNGTMIHSNEEIKLSHGTKIRLANEDFEFRFY